MKIKISKILKITLIIRDLFLLMLIIMNFSYIVPAAQPDASSLGIISVAPGQSVDDYIVLKTDLWIDVKSSAVNTDWILSFENTPATKQGILSVDSNGKWQIIVSADNVTRGHLTEYDVAASRYVSNGKRILHPLKIRAEGGTEVDLSKGGPLAEGFGEQMIPITFEQDVSWDDEPLPKDHIYKINLIYNGFII